MRDLPGAQRQTLLLLEQTLGWLLGALFLARTHPWALSLACLAQSQQNLCYISLGRMGDTPSLTSAEAPHPPRLLLAIVY